jgi:hypothetical protein
MRSDTLPPLFRSTSDLSAGCRQQVLLTCSTGLRDSTTSNQDIYLTVSPERLKQNFSQNFIGKGKAIPLQLLTGPEGSSRLRLPDFMTIGTGRWQGCQPYAPAVFTPRKYSWYSFLLEAESTPGP